MEHFLSEAQADLLGALERKVLVLFDGDNARRKGAELAAKRLEGKATYDIIVLPEGKELETLSKGEIARIQFRDKSTIKEELLLDIGSFLRSRRKKLDLTQKNVATALDTTTTR